MRKLVAIFLILILLLPVLGKLGVWAHYQANLRYYAEVLCENRDKPDLNCDGHCVLAQRIAATAPQPPAAPSAQLFQFELGAFLQCAAPTSLPLATHEQRLAYWIPLAEALSLAPMLGIAVPPPDDVV